MRAILLGRVTAEIVSASHIFRFARQIRREHREC